MLMREPGCKSEQLQTETTQIDQGQIEYVGNTTTIARYSLRNCHINCE